MDCDSPWPCGNRAQQTKQNSTKVITSSYLPTYLPTLSQLVSEANDTIILKMCFWSTYGLWSKQEAVQSHQLSHVSKWANVKVSYYEQLHEFHLYVVMCYCYLQEYSLYLLLLLH